MTGSSCTDELGRMLTNIFTGLEIQWLCFSMDIHKSVFSYGIYTDFVGIVRINKIMLHWILTDDFTLEVLFLVLLEGNM